ncbi:hypothetical protein NVV30_23040 [Pseudomonas syringae]|uniref:hypothetical protein n=1 Tax=Pseudomonas syringae TaxID=317 RepID=UPI00215A6C7D|nr:hypothetical protein [Pseudomonas syringae]MCR8721558.1 hypothetical protein [Pseudomonas syringae]
MKIWACAKNFNGFINREDGRYKLYFIWQILKMKRENPAAFSALTFFSTHSREDKRREMVAVKNGYFRYKSAETVNLRSGDSDGETLPHAYLIAVLSQLQTINFKIGHEVVPFTFTRLVAEETRLRFGNGKVYIPDLYGEFTSDNPYYKKWGGKVAIEVCYSNPCSPQKIFDFQEHGIPIIEIKIAKSINIETYIDKNDIEGSIERGYQKITDIASTQLFCKVLSDPVSTLFHQEYAKLAEKNRVDLADKTKREMSALSRKYRETESLVSEVSKQRDSIAEAKGKLAKDKAALVASNDSLTKAVQKLKVELEKYKSADTKRINEANAPKGELENAKAGFFTKIWQSITSKKS